MVVLTVSWTFWLTLVKERHQVLTLLFYVSGLSSFGTLVLACFCGLSGSGPGAWSEGGRVQGRFVFQRLRDLILVCLVYLVLLRLPLVSSCLGDKRVMPAEGWHSAGEENLTPGDQEASWAGRPFGAGCLLVQLGVSGPIGKGSMSSYFGGVRGRRSLVLLIGPLYQL